jgi:signal transduction histidine kinase/CheY-like chemotaxis protein
MKRISKMQLFTMAAVALLIIFFGLFLYMGQINRELSANTVNTMEEIAAHDKGFIENYLDRTCENLTGIGIRLRNGKFKNIRALQAQLSLELSSSQFRYLYLVDKQGKMISGAFLIQDGTKYYYIYNILEGIPKTITRYNEAVAVDSQDEAIVYALSMEPFKVEDKEFIGIVGQTLVNDVRKHMTVDSFNKRGNSLLIDKDGYYIVNYSYKNGIGQQDNMFENLAKANFQAGFSLDKLKTDLQNNKEFACSYTLAGIPYNLTVLPLEAVDWSLAVTVPNSVFMDQSKEFIFFTMVLLVAVVFIFLIMIAGIFRTWKMSVEARAAADAKSSFLNKMSHEIRTPLNAIIGLNYLMRDNLDKKEELNQYLDKTASTSQYLLSLINDILDISKMEQSPLIMNHEAISLNSLVSSATNIMKEVIEAKSIDFTVINHLSHPFIIGDEMRLEQVILNILSNAVKFTPAQGKITMELDQQEKNDNRVETIIKITDTGIGMSEEFQKHIFESFTQENRTEIDPTVGSEHHGSGLGMAISYLLMKRMNGNLSVTSLLGKGSSFTASWLAEITTEAKILTNPKPMPNRVTIPTAGKKHILIAEDNKLNANILVKLLERRNYATVVAADGQQAVDLFNASTWGFYNAILMDVQMPVMDGFDAARAIRDTNRPDAKTIRIYACTANTATEDRRKAEEAGMNGFIAKPIDIKKLLAILQNC